jgi:hypothetical protein
MIFQVYAKLMKPLPASLLASNDQKTDFKWLSLATIPVLGQAPRQYGDPVNIKRRQFKKGLY